MKDTHICVLGLYISAVKVRAESHTLLLVRLYAPFKVLPSIGSQSIFNPAWIISQGTDGYVLDGHPTLPSLILCLIWFSYYNAKHNALLILSTVTANLAPV